MDEHISKRGSKGLSVRDRRYAIRFPFAADASLIDLETGGRSEGVTSDVSLGGCFVCTSKTLSVKSRVRVTLTRKEQKVEALGVVRVVKPRVGMGVEFLDLESRHMEVLRRWVEQVTKAR